MRGLVWWSIAVLSLLLAGCARQTAAVPAAPEVALATPTGELQVFAAASLTEAFNEIGKNFEAANPGVRVSFNFAGSQQLAQQIGQGAPADVFASANTKQMEVVIKAGQVISGSDRTFAHNRLVLIYPQGNPAKLATLKDLANPAVKLVLAAKAVPAGQYALDLLGKASQLPEYTASYSPTVLANVVSYEANVRAVLSKVVLGEADAGIVYASDISRDLDGKVGKIDIPDTLNTIADYPIAPIKDARQASLAGRFIAYVLAPAAQAILNKYGFISVAS